MAERETSNVNYSCPVRSCREEDIGSLPLCPNPYTICPICIKETNPKLYKEIFHPDKK